MKRDHDINQHNRDCDRDRDWTNKDGKYYLYVPLYDRAKGKELSSINSEKFKSEYVLAHILIGVEGANKMFRELKSDFSQLNQKVISHSASINQLKSQIGQILAHLNARPNGGLPRDMITNYMNYAHVMTIDTTSGQNLCKDIVDSY